MSKKRFNFDGLTEPQLRALQQTIEKRITQNQRDVRRDARGEPPERVAICGAMTERVTKTSISTEGLRKLTGRKLSRSLCQKLRNGNQPSLTREQLGHFAKAVGHEPQDFILFT